MQYLALTAIGALATLAMLHELAPVIRIAFHGLRIVSGV